MTSPECFLKVSYSNEHDCCNDVQSGKFSFGKYSYKYKHLLELRKDQASPLTPQMSKLRHGLFSYQSLRGNPDLSGTCGEGEPRQLFSLFTKCLDCSWYTSLKASLPALIPSWPPRNTSQGWSRSKKRKVASQRQRRCRLLGKPSVVLRTVKSAAPSA